MWSRQEEANRLSVEHVGTSPCFVHGEEEGEAICMVSVLSVSTSYQLLLELVARPAAPVSAAMVW